MLFPEIDIRQRLTLQSGYGVMEIPVDVRSDLCGQTIVSSALRERDVLVLTIQRGSVTIHDERIVHGSGGNSSDVWRKTYVMAFRPQETVEEERAMGFTHSHNDTVNWETFIQ